MANKFDGPENQGYGPAHHVGATTPLPGAWPAQVPIYQMNAQGELEDEMFPERESVTTLTSSLGSGLITALT